MNALIKEQPSIDNFTQSMAAEVAAGNLEQVHPEPIHYHTAALYGRRIVVPAGVVFTTKVHKTDHIAVALRGHITIVDEHGNKKDVRAPDVFITPKGTHRAIYVHEEIEWLTVHHCEEQDIDRIEKELVCESMAEYQHLQLEAPQ